MADEKMEYTREGINLENLVDYQDKAVVSKALIQKPVGSLTLFAFDRDEGLSEHTAPYDAFVQILDGRARITIDGKPFTLSRGDMIIMPAGKPHSLAAIERFKMLLVMIRG